MPGCVSVGLNGSPESMAAARWAAGEARLRELPMRLIYAGDWLPPADHGTPEEPTVADGWPARLLATAVEEIGLNHPGLLVTGEERKELPVEALTSEASAAVLLALGSRALGEIGGFVFGSTALGVLARAVRPVVLVRGGRISDDAPRIRPSSHAVVLGLGGEQGAGPLLEFAFEAAALRGTVLRVVHTWWPALPHGSHTEPATVAGAGPAEVVSETLRPWRSKYPGVPVDELCIKGRAATELVKAAATASLMVVGRRLSHHPLGPRIGPVTHAVVHHALCPVAVVPHG